MGSDGRWPEWGLQLGEKLGNYNCDSTDWRHHGQSAFSRDGGLYPPPLPPHTSSRHPDHPTSTLILPNALS